MVWERFFYIGINSSISCLIACAAGSFSPYFCATYCSCISKLSSAFMVMISIGEGIYAEFTLFSSSDGACLKRIKFYRRLSCEWNSIFDSLLLILSHLRYLGPQS